MKTIDYYFSAISPWAYLGHARLCDIAHRSGATVVLRPFDLGQIFPVSGGLPLAKRAPQRQAYRLVELQRTSAHLNVPMNIQPAHFPVSPDLANQLIIATLAACGAETALSVTAAIMSATWAGQLNISDEAVLAGLLTELGQSVGLLELAKATPALEAYAAHSQTAIAAGVFGAPSYVVDGEIFWGQDRLDFLARKLGLSA